MGKILKSVIINNDFESCKLLHSSQTTTKQPLSNFEVKSPENISIFQDWGLTLVAYKKISAYFLPGFLCLISIVWLDLDMDWSFNLHQSIYLPQ